MDNKLIKEVPEQQSISENEDMTLEDEIVKEFSEFCSDSWIKARGGCCRLICTIDEFLPHTPNKGYNREH